MTQTFPVPTHAQNLMDLNRQAIDTAHQLSLAAFNGLEKLLQLNAQAIKANWDEQVLRTNALLDARTPDTVGETLNQAATPASEKLSSYTQHLINISQETVTEMQKILQKQFGEQGQQFHAAVERMGQAIGQSVPNGFEGILPMFRSAVDSANDMVDQYNKNSRQIVDMAEAQFNEAAATVRSAAPRRKSA